LGGETKVKAKGQSSSRRRAMEAKKFAVWRACLMILV